jgi:hypothetical protein
LGVAGLVVGLLLTYFFASCPIPPGDASDVVIYQDDDDVCGPDIASIAIRPPDLVIPLLPLGPTNAPLEFEVEALAYRSDGGGIPPECDLGLVWEATPPISAPQPITGNRARLTINSAALASSFDAQVSAWLPDDLSVSGTAYISVEDESPGIRDSVRADHDGTVVVSLVDGAAAYPFMPYTSYKCFDTQPVSFVSVGRLPNLGALCQKSFETAAIFGAKRRAWYHQLTSGSWGWNTVDKVDATGKSAGLEPIEVAVWIVISDDSQLDNLSLSEARDEALYDAISDEAWANLVYRNERVGLQLYGNVEIVGDESHEQDDLSLILNGGPYNVDDYPQLTSAYDPDQINIYFVGRSWGSRHFPATDDRAPVIRISWIPSWRPEPSTLAHEVGHALGLKDLSVTGGAADNLMYWLLGEWRSRLSVGQLFLMNFSDSSWAVLRDASRPSCKIDPIDPIDPRCPAWDVGIGR